MQVRFESNYFVGGKYIKRYLPKMSGTTMGYTMTLANSIIGVGILAMPFCFQKCGILLSILLLIFSNLITRLTCNYLLQTSIRSRRRNFESMALHIFGSSGKLLVELCIIGYLFGSCVTYYVVVGDLGPQIISSLFDISISDSLRTVVMAVVTIVCIIPLSLLRNMESLSHVSTTSIIFYFCLVFKIVSDSEEKITSNYWIDNIYWWRPSGILQCLPIFCMSLSCQTQMFEVYESLPNQSLEKMNRIIKAATNICTGVYILVGVFGYVAYSGQQFSGNILLSFSPSLVSEIIKLGFVLSVAFSFPLVIFPCRASLYSMIYHRSHSEVSHYIPEHRFQYITVSIVLTALIIGILIPSIELVIGLVGSTIGVAICIMFPASCYIKTNKKGSTERLLAQFLLVFAFVLMILGTFANLEAIDEKQAGIHDQPPLNSVVDPVPFVEKLPQSVEDFKPLPQADESRNSGSIGKRKPNKTHKIASSHEAEQIAAPVNISAQEGDSGGAKADSQLIGPSKETIANKIGPDMKVAEEKAPEVVPDKEEKPDVKKTIAEPERDRSANAKVDSAINKDAIQREEQEIAIDAKEDKQKSLETAKEILNEVKSELAKQNEKTQQLVLEKIDKISEKVNKIEQLQEEEKQRESASLKKHEDEVVEPKPAIEEHRNKNDKKNNKEDEKPAEEEVVKAPEPEPENVEAPELEKVKKPELEKVKLHKADVVKDPIVKSILPKANVEQNVNVDEPAPEIGEKIGRDLLSVKLEDDQPVKSRRKRSPKSNEYVAEEENWPKNSIRLKNMINPKYTERVINYYKDQWRGKFEIFGSSDLHPPLANSKRRFDDKRFEKYAGLDDSYVFHVKKNADAKRDADLQEDKDKDRNHVGEIIDPVEVQSATGMATIDC